MQKETEVIDFPDKAEMAMPSVSTLGVRDAGPHGTEGIDNDEISMNYLMSGRKPYIYKCVDTIHS